MASAITIHLADGLITVRVTAEDKKQFEVLWGEHLTKLAQGKLVYYFPQNMGTQMGVPALHEMANKLKGLSTTPIFVHYDFQKSVYRIGELVDQDDRDSVASCLLIPETSSNGAAAQVHPVLQQTVVAAALLPNIPNNNLIAAGHSIATPVQKIPKPRNMWIIYRQDKHHEVLAQNPGMHTSKISTLIARMWSNESAEVRFRYKKLADDEKFKHQQMYPGFKCAPRKSSDIKKRKTRTKVTSLVVRSPAPALRFPSAEATGPSSQGGRRSSKKTRDSQAAPHPTSAMPLHGPAFLSGVHPHQPSTELLAVSSLDSPNPRAMELEYDTGVYAEVGEYNAAETNFFDGTGAAEYFNNGTHPILDDKFYAGYCDAVDNFPLERYLEGTESLDEFSSFDFELYGSDQIDPSLI